MTNPEPWLPESAEDGTYITVAERAWGPQVRELFTVLPGYTMVGADSAGNQFRALCHYLGPEAAEYTRIGISEDIHTFHANILSEVVPGTNRGTAKPFFYAYIFGAGDGKIGLILTGIKDSTIGKKAKSLFESRIPGFKNLVEKLNRIFRRSNDPNGASIPAIDGRKIYVDSRHKLLNYLLQSCEKVTCAAAAASILEQLDNLTDDWQPLIFYHDETQIMVPDALAEQARVIAQEAFRDAPKDFGVVIMDGDAKLGKNWKDTH